MLQLRQGQVPPPEAGLAKTELSPIWLEPASSQGRLSHHALSHQHHPTGLGDDGGNSLTLRKAQAGGATSVPTAM